jgi:Uma2 family endonuclease
VTSRPATRRFSVREYHEMAVSGILIEDDRVELIEGEIVEMPPIGSRHAACVSRLNQLFSTELGGSALVRVKDSVRLSERSEPEPDLTLVKPRADYYAGSHPGPEDVLLVVDVADTSTGYDRSVKVPLYGRAGIREMWLVDLELGRIEVLREPFGDGYRTVHAYGREDRLSFDALPHIQISVDSLLR